MAQTMASAIVLPDEDAPPNGLKRRRSGDDDKAERKAQADDSKRRRTSSGKDSPAAAMPTEEDTAAQIQQEPTPAASESPIQNQPVAKTDDSRESRRKSAVADERQRSKRLFGALLGNLNQPGDRVSKRRGEIEQRKKAELKKQDDERLEDRQRRLEKLDIQRKREQIRVDEDNMRARHKQILNTANFLQTAAEPKLYYRPWDLLPDEEDRIDDQIKDANAQIDQELTEWDIEKRKRLEALEGSSNGDHTGDVAMAKTPQQPKQEAEGTAEKNQDDANEHAKNDDTNQSDVTKRPTEVVDGTPDVANDSEHKASEAGAAKELDSQKAAQDVTMDDTTKDDPDDEDHVVEGDEDNVIY